MRTEVCIIGGGASGLFCAATAARRGRRVLVLDHATRPGLRILASGGGRCNFTNRRVSADDYLSQNPHFCRSALARFTPADVLALVEAQGLAIEERDHGRVFCRDAAQGFLDLLLASCRQAGVELRWGVGVREVSHQDHFRITTTQGEVAADRLVIATGGLARPALGCSDLGLRLARQFGHDIVTTGPALAPLRLGEGERLDLAGIAVEVQIAVEGGPAFRDQLLFTHGGISGPAGLRASSHWRQGLAVQIDLLPGRSLAEELPAARGVTAHLINHLATALPRRLVQARLPAPLAGKPVAQLSRADIAVAVTAMHRWILHPAGVDGWDKAEVMRGGVDTTGLSSQTLESRRVPGLHIIGEVVDVTGDLGGYNLHWAWASGHAAGLAV